MLFRHQKQESVDSVQRLQSMLNDYCDIEDSKYPNLNELKDVLFHVNRRHDESILVRMLSRKYDTIGTPLHNAAVHGHGEVVTKFIQPLSDGHTLSLLKVCKYGDSGEDSWTAIHEAAYYGDVYFLYLMNLYLSASVHATLMTVRYDGLTAIEWARHEGCEGAARQLESYYSVNSIVKPWRAASERDRKWTDEVKVTILEGTTTPKIGSYPKFEFYFLRE